MQAFSVYRIRKEQFILMICLSLFPLKGGRKTRLFIDSAQLKVSEKRPLFLRAYIPVEGLISQLCQATFLFV